MTWSSSNGSAPRAAATCAATSGSVAWSRTKLPIWARAYGNSVSFTKAIEDVVPSISVKITFIWFY